jgi:glycosyltransferase involved in cell wall biosynthesis
MARLLVSALRLAGHRVELASHFRSWDGDGNVERQRRLQRIGQWHADRLLAAWHDMPNRRRPELWFTYHLYHKAPDWLGPRVSRGLGIPYVVAEASHAEKQSGGPWAFGWWAAADALRHADAVLILNRNDESGLRRLLGEAKSLIRLPAFVDAGQGSSTERGLLRSRLARHHSLCEYQPWLLAVGMFRQGDKLASFRLLAAALGRLLHVPWRLVVVGDGPARAEVRDCLDALGPERTLMVGQCEEKALSAWYQASDLLVWPACNEAYGMALLEAQAAGLPVVAGRSGGVGEIVENGATGILVRESGVDEFAAAVARLLEDGPLREAMGAAARRRVESEHSIERAAQILDDALAGICP